VATRLLGVGTRQSHITSSSNGGRIRWTNSRGPVRWIEASRLHTLIPRGTDRWKKLYRQRGSVERENGRLKNEWGLSPLRVRRIERVRLHADLTILARLTCALDTARAVPLAA
jgi:transposase